MLSEQAQGCDCGHGRGLHDEFGCAAYLGAFAATVGEVGHCRCPRPKDHGFVVPCLDGDPAAAASA